MKELYNDIDSWMTQNLDGWSTKRKVAALVGAIMAIEPMVVVELGVWSGRSLIPMAMALKHLKSKGFVIGIDPWSGAASAEGMEGEHKKWWAEAPHERIYKQFTDELVKTGVAPWTKIFRCKSDDWNIPPDLSIDLLHGDGNHGEFSSTFDVTHYAPRVRVGGFLYWDDKQWTSKAASMIPTLGFIPLFDEDGGTMFQRVSKG
jgi:hypothetical protein